MPTGTTKIILTGENARAIKAINEVATASEKSAAKSSSAFDKSTSKVGGAFTKLDRTLGSFGIPFVGALGVMGSKLEESGKKSKGLKDNLSALGGGIALGAAAGIALIGGSAIKAALEGEAAQARLDTAVKNTGANYDAYGSRIDNLNDKMAGFGFQNDDVANALSRLIPATHDVGKAIDLMGLAADISAARGIDLVSATDLLTKVEQGRYTQLGKLGVASKEQIKGFHSSADAVEFLTQKYKGSAAAAADTYEGKLKALAARAHNLQEELGNKLLPIVENGVTTILGASSAFDKANEATGGWLGKIALAGAAVPVAVFAIDKLAKAGSAVVGAYGRVGDAIGKTISAVTGATTANEALTVSTVELSTAEEIQAVAAANAAAATVTAGAAADAAVLGTGAAAEAAGVAAAASLGLAVVPLATIAVGAVAAGAAAFGLSKAFDAIFGTKDTLTDDQIKQLAQDLAKTGSAATDAQEKLSKVFGGPGAAELAKYSDLLLANADKTDLAASKATLLGDAYRAVGERFGVTGQALDDLSHGKIDNAVAGNEALVSALGHVKKGADESTGALDDLVAQYGNAAVQSATLTAAEKTYGDLLASHTATAEQLAAARAAVVAASREQAGTQGQVNSAVDEGTGAAKENADATKEQADAAKALADELKGLYDAENAVLGSQLSFKESTHAVSKAVQDHTEKTLIAIKAKGKDKKANEDVTESSFSLSHAILSAGQSASQTAQDAETLRQKNLGLTDSALVATAGHNAEVSALRALERQFPALKPEIEGYIRTLNLIPPSKRTEVSAPGAIDATRQVQSFTNAVNAAAGRVTVYFNPNSRAPGRPYAAGGPVVGNVPILVGEKGPEMFVPSSAGMIVPNNALGRSSGGYASVTNINIYASGIGDRELGRQVVQALREYQRTRGPLNLKIAG